MREWGEGAVLVLPMIRRDAVTGIIELADKARRSRILHGRCGDGRSACSRRHPRHRERRALSRPGPTHAAADLDARRGQGDHLVARARRGAGDRRAPGRSRAWLPRVHHLRLRRRRGHPRGARALPGDTDTLRRPRPADPTRRLARRPAASRGSQDRRRGAVGSDTRPGGPSLHGVLGREDLPQRPAVLRGAAARHARADRDAARTRTSRPTISSSPTGSASRRRSPFTMRVSPNACGCGPSRPCC